MEQNKIIEEDFLMSALNSFWHQANAALERKDLGDIERKNYQSEKDKSSAMMDELERNGLPYKKGNEQLKRLLHDLTPGGSEFYNDPEYCAKWIRENRQQESKILKEMVKAAKDKNESLQQRNKELLDALQPLAKLADAVWVDTRKDKEGVLYAFNAAEITYTDLRKAKKAIEANQIK